MQQAQQEQMQRAMVEPEQMGGQAQLAVMPPYMQSYADDMRQRAQQQGGLAQQSMGQGAAGLAQLPNRFRF
jgi:hypothetical protein